MLETSVGGAILVQTARPNNDASVAVTVGDQAWERLVAKRGRIAETVRSSVKTDGHNMRRSFPP